MKKYFFFLICLGLTNVLDAQNVGIGTTTPAEKLDINGNINVTGTIKANGVDGLPNQVLMKNTSGNLAWGDLSEYKNFVTFTAIGTFPWVVPAGVTKIVVELWGGGGGATLYGGGGGGGYISAVMLVTPGGTVYYTVGAGGISGGVSATIGGPSVVTYGPYSITAFGGVGSVLALGNAAAGGNYGVSAAATSYYYQSGEAGGANKFEYYHSGATTFNESQTGGKGGDAGNSTNTGGKAAYIVRNTTTSTTIYQLYGSGGKIPGGGAGGLTTFSGVIYNGGPGMVIIHY